MTQVGMLVLTKIVSERLKLVEVIETQVDYRSAKALRHEDGYLEWVESEKNSVTNLTH